MDDLFALLEQNHPEAIHLMIDLYNVTKDELVVEFLLKSSQYEDVVPRTFLVQLNKLLLADLKGCIKKYCQDERLKNYLLKNFNAEQIPFSQYNTLLHKKKIIKEKLTDLEVKKLEFDYYEDHLHFNKLHHFLRNTQVFIEKKKEEEHHQDKQDLIKEMCAITHDFFNDVTFCTFSVENYKQFDHYIFLSTRSRVFLFKLTEPQKEGDPSELDQLISMMNCILIKLDKEERFANIEISYDYKTVLFGNISMLSNFVDSYFAS